MGEIPKLPSAASEALAGTLSGVGATRSAPRGAGAQSASPAFEALLERLTTRAAELDQKSKTLSAPEELPAALDAARSSLEDALTLGEELLEAYRVAQHRGPEQA